MGVPLRDDAVDDRAGVASNSRRSQFINDRRGCLAWIKVDPAQFSPPGSLKLQRPIVSPSLPVGVILLGEDRQAGPPGDAKCCVSHGQVTRLPAIPSHMVAVSD
jgi:hypothetical protein